MKLVEKKLQRFEWMPTTMPKMIKLDTHYSLIDPDADYRRELKWVKKDEILDESTTADVKEEWTVIPEKKWDKKALVKA